MSKKILFSIIYITATMIAEAIAMLILIAIDINEKDFLINGAVTTILIKIIFTLLWTSCNRYFMKDNTYVDLLLPKKISIFSLIVPSISLIFLSIVLYSILFYKDIPAIFLMKLVFFVIIVNLIMFVSFINISNYYSEIIRNRSYQHFLKEQNEYWEKIDSTRESLNIQLHDLKNSYSVVLGIIQSGNINEAEKYLSEKIEYADSLKPTFYSSNPILNNFLSYKFSNVEKYGITAKVKVFIDDYKVISNDMLANILGNLIDNSINACKKNMSGEREIDLFIKYFDKTLLIKITNPISETYKVFVPGTGIKSISTLVEKYGGVFESSIEDGKHKSTIILWDKSKGGLL